MSYILEALKKAQAERQLGSAPTIHASPVAVAPADNAARKPLVAAGAAVALLAAAGLYAWHQQATPPLQLAAVPARVSTPAAVPAPVRQVPGPAATVGVRVALVGKADPPPRAPAPEAPAGAKPAVRAPASQAKPAAAAPVALAGNAPTPVAPVRPAPAAVSTPGAEDAIGGVNSLPEAVRRDLPKVAFGGYMYSPNPADRLVLVDNILRREGEEVAAGLMLEKLLPKGAVMNFRGYRYRVPF